MIIKCIMFATFNYEHYDSKSIVFVKLTNVINDTSFNMFIKEWIQLYRAQKKFTFVFDTTDVGFIPLNYSIMMSSFISKLKKEPRQYLQKSIILIKNNFVKYMLDFIFYLQPPVAPVHIVQNKDDINNIINGIVPHNIITIYPSQSFFS